jgi:hypothetical protein
LKTENWDGYQPSFPKMISGETVLDFRSNSEGEKASLPKKAEKIGWNRPNNQPTNKA